MINVAMIVLLSSIFLSIIYKLVKDAKNGCPPSCSGCPVVHSCHKDTIKEDLKALLSKSD